MNDTSALSDIGIHVYGTHDSFTGFAPINYNGVLYYDQIMITYSYEKVNCKYGHCILWFSNRVDEHINFNSYSYQMVLLFFV